MLAGRRLRTGERLGFGFPHQIQGGKGNRDGRLQINLGGTSRENIDSAKVGEQRSNIVCRLIQARRTVLRCKESGSD